MPPRTPRHKGLRTPQDFAKRLEELKAVNDGKTVHAEEVDMLHRMVVNSDWSMKDKIKMLDEVWLRYRRL